MIKQKKMSKTIEEAAREYANNAYYPAPDYGWYESDDEQMKECLSNAFKTGANHVYGLPLTSRMTEEEKERVRKIYTDELEMAQHFHVKAKASNDVSCRQHYFGLREPYISLMKLLERIFGKEMFEKE